MPVSATLICRKVPRSLVSRTETIVALDSIKGTIFRSTLVVCRNYECDGFVRHTERGSEFIYCVDPHKHPGSYYPLVRKKHPGSSNIVINWQE